MISYLGSKFSLSDFIVPNIPINPKTWIEPFGGSFGLFFSLDLNKFEDTEFIYNDINPLNSDLFKSLKIQKFIDLVKSTTISQQLFNESFTKIKSIDRSERSLGWLIILSCGEISNPMSMEFKGSTRFDLLKQKIDRYKNYFDRIKIHNMDYKKIIKKYDSPDSFFYVDPPYFGYENYYYNSQFSNDSHEELSKILKSVKGKWALSYYPFEKMNDFYSEFNFKSKKHNLSEEFLITNYL